MKSAQLLIIMFCLMLTADNLSAQQGKPLSTNFSTVEQTIFEVQDLLKSENAADAVVLLEQSLQKFPHSEKLTYWLGKVYYSQGNYQKASENLALVNGKFPENSVEQNQIIQMLGLANYVSGHLGEAIPYLEKILLQQPANGEIAYALGVSYIQMRQPEKSRIVYANLFKVPVSSASAYLLNAKMHMRQEFEETAEIELNKAIILDPKLPDVRFVLGELAIYKADIDKGINLLRQEIILNPANSMAYYRLGEGLSRQLKWDEAIPPLQKSIWLNPFFSGPYIVLGKVYFKKQDLGNAENLLRRSVQIDPNNFGAHYLLGQVLQQAGKADDAKAEFALAEKLRGEKEQNP